MKTIIIETPDISTLSPENRAQYEKMKRRYEELVNKVERTDEDRAEMVRLCEAAKRMFDKFQISRIKNEQ